MVRTLGLVEVLPAQGQWPSAGALWATRRFGNKTLLEWIVRRISDCQQLDGVAIVCCDSPQRSQIERIAPPDVPVLASGAADPLGCLAEAVSHFDARAIVRVGVDRPFVDPALIDRVVASAHSGGDVDYASFCRRDGRPAVLAPIGLVAEWCRGTAIQRADQEATDPQDRWQPTRYIYQHPELFQLRLIPLPEPLDRDDLRLGISDEEDWDLAQEILEALGPEGVEWQRITGLLDHQPALRQRMAKLNQQR